MVEKVNIFESGRNTDKFKKRFFHTLLKDVMSVVKVDCGSLFLFDCATNELILDSYYNSVELKIKGLKRRIGEGISGKVAGFRTPVLVKDIDADARFIRNGFGHYRTKSFISIPLICSNKLIGLINLTDKSNGQPFSEVDLKAAMAVVKYGSLTFNSLQKYISVRLEKKALDKQKILLEKYASVGKLASGIVHEVNNPLDGIIRYTNILLSHLEGNPAAREYLLEVKKGLARIAGITRSLLEFAYQLNSSPAHAKRYVELNKVIDESLEMFHGRIEGNVRIVKRYWSEPLCLLDFGLHHVVVNIVKNALDAMPDGGVLEIDEEVTAAAVKIRFKDTGTGIPAETLERIFDPFFTTKSVEKGTGLGLSITREIVNRYEGDIQVESLPQQGATFWVVIPKRYLKNT